MWVWYNLHMFSLDTILDLATKFGHPALEALMVFLLGALLFGVRRLPAVLLRLAREFEKQAKSTEGKADDVAAKFLVTVAEAAVAAAEKELGTSKSAPGDKPKSEPGKR